MSFRTAVFRQAFAFNALWARAFDRWVFATRTSDSREYSLRHDESSASSAYQMSSPPPPPEQPLGLVLGSGFKQYMQKAVWIGVEPSSEAVAKFKAAHCAVAAPTAKHSKAARAAQKAKGVSVPVSPVSPLAWLSANATRLAVCALPAGRKSRCCASLRLRCARCRSKSFVAGGAIAAPLPLPQIKDALHKRAMAALLAFLLNAPDCRRCLSVRHNDRRMHRDPENHSTRIRKRLRPLAGSLSRNPTPQQQSTSLTVCFWCGASPLSKDITLFKCNQCECVAYCSELCQASDWEAEHHRECSRTEKGVHETAVFGLPSLPASELSITRIATETSKVQRGTVQVLEKSDEMFDVTGATIRVPMGWEVEA
ncbi:hypothetical protein BDR26DRAFT_923192 [Obelidium mucronatum]|nr:hypothetical protein BDR26DRAFT_923192 [Obelidium mucronatum]